MLRRDVYWLKGGIVLVNGYTLHRGLTSAYFSPHYKHSVCRLVQCPIPTWMVPKDFCKMSNDVVNVCLECKLRRFDVANVSVTK